jgi:tetratricopeptide (TPR) repeat protein
MNHTNWLEILGWKEGQLEDLRFVGFSYIKEGKYEIALRFFEALTILNPKSEYDMQTLGALYLQMGNNLAALDFLERAIKLNKDHPSTLLNRAKALLMLGYKKQGIDQAKVLETHPIIEIANQAKALLLAYK